MPTITAGSLATGDTTTNFTQAFDSRNAGAESLVPSWNRQRRQRRRPTTPTPSWRQRGTINQLAITVTAAGDTKTYDGTTASSGVPTITAGNLATGDTTTSFTQVFDSRNAGSPLLTPSGIVNDGNGGANYSYTFATAAGTINQLAITITAASDTKTYDGTINSAGVPIITPGIGAGDSPEFTQIFDSRNAALALSPPAESSTTATAATITCTTFVTTAGTINPLAITVTAASEHARPTTARRHPRACRSSIRDSGPAIRRTSPRSSTAGTRDHAR